jgi:8-oxo-dGTP diphosphatase
MPGRFHLIPAVHIFVTVENSLLLLRRANTGYEDGRLSVPAGHLDGGESVTQAASRELREELGIEVEPGGLRFAHVMHRRKEDGEERVDFFLSCHRWKGEIENAEPDKCSELVWAVVTELPDDTVGYVRSAIEKASAEISFSEPGWR